MMTRLIEDATEHVLETRLKRCGGTLWVPPPQGWELAVQAAWPTVYFRAPYVPDGWVDIILSMSEHAYRLMAEFQVVDIFENVVTGYLQVRSSGRAGPEFEGICEIIDAYECVSSGTCVECGGPGRCRTIGKSSFRLRVLCDVHSGGRQ